MEPPAVSILSGTPSAEEEQAIRHAILRLWRDSLAGGERRPDPWVVAARAASTRTRIVDMPAGGWALSLRFESGPMMNRRTGAGGAR